MAGSWYVASRERSREADRGGSASRGGATSARYLRRGSLEHVVRIGLNHPNVLALRRDEQIETRSIEKNEGALAGGAGRFEVRDGIAASHTVARRHFRDDTVQAPRRAGARQRAVAVETNPFDDRFRLRRREIGRAH